MSDDEGENNDLADQDSIALRRNSSKDRKNNYDAEYKKEVTDRQIRTMHERDIWVPPER